MNDKIIVDKTHYYSIIRAAALYGGAFNAIIHIAAKAENRGDAVVIIDLAELHKISDPALSAASDALDAMTLAQSQSQN